MLTFGISISQRERRKDFLFPCPFPWTPDSPKIKKKQNLIHLDSYGQLAILLFWLKKCSHYIVNRPNKEMIQRAKFTHPNFVGKPYLTCSNRISMLEGIWEASESKYPMTFPYPPGAGASNAWLNISVTCSKWLSLASPPRDSDSVGLGWTCSFWLTPRGF